MTDDTQARPKASRYAKLATQIEDVRQRMLKRTANARRTKFDVEVMITLQMARDALLETGQ